mgnify:CR=1 FL=1
MGKNKAARKAAPDFESRTYESLMAAARAAKTIEQKRGVLIQLNEVAAERYCDMAAGMADGAQCREPQARPTLRLLH